MQSKQFDPYHEWLGIPKSVRPPTHYQLLGIAPEEKETRVIEAASLRQSAFVRNFQNGTNGELASKLLAEIVTARNVLLDPAKRKAYDASIAPSAPSVELKKAERPTKKVSTVVESDCYEVRSAESVRRSKPPRASATRKRSKSSGTEFVIVRWVLSAVVVVVAIVIAAKWVNSQRQEIIVAAKTVEEIANNTPNPANATSIDAPQSKESALDKALTTQPPAPQSEKPAQKDPPPKKEKQNKPSMDEAPAKEEKAAEKKPKRLGANRKQEEEDPEEKVEEVPEPARPRKRTKTSAHKKSDWIVTSTSIGENSKSVNIRVPSNRRETDMVVEEALDILESDNTDMYFGAFSYLNSCKPNGRKKEVVEHCLYHLSQRDYGAQAAQVVLIWDKDKGIAAIAKLMRSGDEEWIRSTGARSIQFLGKLKDRKVVALLEDCLEHEHLWHDASRALIEMGSIASSALASSLVDEREMQWDTIIECLERVGTADAIPALERIVERGERHAEAAERAIKSIKKRPGGAKIKKNAKSEDE